MGRRPPFDLRPPLAARSPRALWVAVAVSVGLHALLLALRIVGRPPDPVRAPNQLVVLRPMETPAVVLAMPFFKPTTEPERRPGIPKPPPPRVVEAEPPPPVTVATVPPPPPETPEDTTTVPPAAPGTLALQPGMAAGKLWVRPMPLPPGELAARLRKKDHIALVDSAVTAIVQQYLDSMAREPATLGGETPEWVATVGGKEFGLTQRNIIVAGLRIPAAILRFLPFLNKATDADPSRALTARQLKDMRDDLIRAAERARNYQDYKQAILDIRKRKQEEHDFEQNQRTPPPPMPETRETP